MQHAAGTFDVKVPVHPAFIPADPTGWSLKRNVPVDPAVTVLTRMKDQVDPFFGIRCPLCAWQPNASSRWCCDPRNSPEPYFDGCWTDWNTFSTGGRCPGCSHQWMWTSCLTCGGWSLHQDWYHEPDA